MGGLLSRYFDQEDIKCQKFILFNLTLSKRVGRFAFPLHLSNGLYNLSSYKRAACKSPSLLDAGQAGYLVSAKKEFFAHLPERRITFLRKGILQKEKTGR